MRQSKTETDRGAEDDVVPVLTATRDFNFPGKTSWLNIHLPPWTGDISGLEWFSRWNTVQVAWKVFLCIIIIYLFSFSVKTWLTSKVFSFHWWKNTDGYTWTYWKQCEFITEPAVNVFGHWDENRHLKNTISFLDASVSGCYTVWLHLHKKNNVKNQC